MSKRIETPKEIKDVYAVVDENGKLVAGIVGLTEDDAIFHFIKSWFHFLKKMSIYEADCIWRIFENNGYATKILEIKQENENG